MNNYKTYNFKLLCFKFKLLSKSIFKKIIASTKLIATKNNIVLQIFLSDKKLKKNFFKVLFLNLS